MQNKQKPAHLFILFWREGAIVISIASLFSGVRIRIKPIFLHDLQFPFPFLVRRSVSAYCIKNVKLSVHLLVHITRKICIGTQSLHPYRNLQHTHNRTLYTSASIADTKKRHNSSKKADNFKKFNLMVIIILGSYIWYLLYYFHILNSTSHQEALS